MNENIRCANDLLIEVHKIHKLHRIDSYYEDIKDILIEQSDCPIQKDRILANFESKSNKLDAYRSIIDEIHEMPPDVQSQVIFEIEDIHHKYDYEKYCSTVLRLKREFMEQPCREDYFRNKLVCNQILENAPDDGCMDVRSFKDSIISLWLDSNLKKTYPHTIDITFEDLNGKICFIKAQHREPVLSDDYIDVDPIDRHTGIGIFDSFYMHSFYDTISRKNVYVPICLIVKATSEHVKEIRPDPSDAEN